MSDDRIDSLDLSTLAYSDEHRKSYVRKWRGERCFCTKQATSVMVLDGTPESAEPRCDEHRYWFSRFKP